ncbi:MAG: DUF6089 family protein [Phycisphaerales bacterium]|nr:DUF6089 family protein [Phycisphaerales bacterium]
MRYCYLLAFSIAVFFANIGSSSAQLRYAIAPTGEWGFHTGVSQYFGDINPKGKFNSAKLALGTYYQKTIRNYFGLNFAFNYVRLGATDERSSDLYYKTRNLSFNTNVWEFSFRALFNFRKFIPGVPGYRFTPYAGLGIGLFAYNPFAYIGGTKYNLRPLGTEGQNVPGSEKKPYSLVQGCFPFTFGLKWNIYKHINLFTEVSYRFTTAKYLDDVSGTYAGADKFLDANGNPRFPAYYLQDRSYVYGTPVGTAGKQRGNGKTDSYLTWQFGISFGFSSYKCPSPY